MHAEKSDIPILEPTDAVRQWITCTSALVSYLVLYLVHYLVGHLNQRFTSLNSDYGTNHLLTANADEKQLAVGRDFDVAYHWPLFSRLFSEAFDDKCSDTSPFPPLNRRLNSVTK